MPRITHACATVVLATVTFACSQDHGTGSGESIATTGDALYVSQSDKLNAMDPWHGDGFGNAVAWSGERVLVGSSSDDVDDHGPNSGSAFVFSRSGAGWVQSKLVPFDSLAGDAFGSAVAIAGDTLVVGASGHDTGFSDGGAAYVFSRVGSAWWQTQKLVAADGGLASEGFGATLAFDGTTLAVGARGVVRIFRTTGELWSEVQKITPPPGASVDGFGRVALSGGTLLVGSPHDAIGSNLQQGAVVVYESSGALFSLVDTLVAPDGAASDHFGTAVAVSSDTALIGTDRALLGAAYVFARAGGSFTLEAKLEATDATSSDRFGVSVALEGDIALIGAPFHEHGGYNGDHGSAYVFRRSGTAWTEAQELYPNDAQNNDHFGSALALTPDSALIGSPNDDVPFIANGSAYVFRFEYFVAEPCASSSQCMSGFCSDGFCCNTACDGACDACSVAAGAEQDGFCAPAPAGSPGAPACAPASCTGTSPDCGGPDENACMRVAPDGDNAAAVASNGATPFRDVQAAIDFADSHRHLATKVCVAAGATCGAVAEYAEPNGRVTMRDGISVLGKHESTSFTRCPDSVTRLALVAPPFVDFGPEIAQRTALDGFEIRGASPGTPIVAVRGARGVELVELVAPERIDPPHVDLNEYGIGIDIEPNSEATLTRCDIFAPHARSFAAAVRALVADVSLLDSTFRADAPCAIGVDVRFPTRLHATGNTVRVAATNSTGSCPEEHVGIRAHVGDVPEFVLEDNDVEIVGQFQSAWGMLVAATHSAEMTGNRVSSRSQDFAGGIFASGPANVAANSVDARTSNGLGYSVGISCDDCAEVTGNTASAFVESSPPCVTTMACTSESEGAYVVGTGTLIDGNDFQGGCGKFARGLTVAGPVRVQNNFLRGGACPSPHRLVKATGITTFDHYFYPGTPDIHSNLLDGGGEGTCTSAGLELLAVRGRPMVRNNLILPGTCNTSFNVDQTTTVSSSERFQNNDLAPGQAGSALYRIQGWPDPTTIEAVNALGPQSSGNFTVACDLPLAPLSPCADAGTQAGAPSHDFESDSRDDGLPDVGPDEL